MCAFLFRPANEEAVFTGVETSIPAHFRKATFLVFAIFFCVLPGFSQLSLQVDKTTNTSCAYSNGYILVEAVGGTAPYFFRDNGSIQQSYGLFTKLSAGSHVIQVTDSKGATATTTINLTNDYPHPNLGILAQTPPTECNADGTVTLNIAGGTPGYAYSKDGSNYQASNLFENLGPGQYTFYAKDANGCAASYPYNISSPCNIIEKPDFTSSACGPNGYIHASLPTGGTPPYEFSLDNSNWTTTGNFENRNPGNYTLYTRDATHAVTQYSLMIHSQCALVVRASTGDSHCATNDGSITVSVPNGIAPLFTAVAGNDYSQSNTISNLASGTYTVQVIDATGNVGSLSNVVVKSYCPTLSLSSEPTRCDRPTGKIVVVQSTGTQPVTYSINNQNGPYSTGTTFSNLSAGTYTVYAKDAHGNIISSDAVVTRPESPQLEATPTAASCSGTDGIIDVTTSGGTPPFQFFINGSNPQTSSRFSSLSPGTYQISAEDANGCQGNSSAVVEIDNSLQVTAGNDTALCKGDDIILNAITRGSVVWSPATGLSDPTKASPTAHPDVTTTYTVTASLGLCSAKDNVTVTVNPLPIADAGPDQTVCFATSATLLGNGGTEYIWSPANMLTAAEIAQPSTKPLDTSQIFTLQVISDKGCKSANTDQVSVFVLPEAKVFAGNDTFSLANLPVQLHATDVNSSGFSIYNWSPSAGLDNPNSPSPIATLSENQTFLVTATTPLGCMATDDIQVKIVRESDIIVPNAFTPNGDGVNDVLHVMPIAMKSLGVFIIFNRYGQIIFRSSDSGIGWDGTVGGQAQPTGAYVWIAEGIDLRGNPVKKQGTFVLIR